MSNDLYFYRRIFFQYSRHFFQYAIGLAPDGGAVHIEQYAAGYKFSFVEQFVTGIGQTYRKAQVTDQVPVLVFTMIGREQKRIVGMAFCKCTWQIIDLLFI